LLLLARKNLFSERIRLIISVGGVALSVFLICILVSLYRGWDEKVGGFVENSDVDVWVGTEGTNDFLAAASVIPLNQTQPLGDETGLLLVDIEYWSPIIVRPMTGLAVEVKDGEKTSSTEVDLHLIGYDPVTEMSGPLEIKEGKETPGPGEVIIDEAVTKRYGIGVGDILEAGGKDWNVVGISKGGDFVASQTVFVTLEEAQAALQMPDLATFIGIRLHEGVEPSEFIVRLEEQFPGVVGFTKAEFADATREQVLGNVLPILTMILVLAFIVGLAVAGLTIYTSTIEKAREFGILKAVGFKNSYLYRLVFEQAITTGAIGFVVGLALTLAFGPFATDLVPQFVTLTRWQDVTFVFIATAIMSVLAGYVPVQRLARIDPTSVFKA
jgi:putative ABC transport system permease protein